jgi:uncharacterized protein (DUF427 family)
MTCALTVFKPNEGHPITTTANPNRIRVTVGGQVVAETTWGISLREAFYPTVLYVPMADVDQELIQRTEHMTYCPYKGEASYYSIPIGGAKSRNAIWTYENPHAAVAVLQHYVAFDANKVDSIEELPEA